VELVVPTGPDTMSPSPLLPLLASPYVGGEEACKLKERASADSCGDVMARAWRSRTAGKALLVAGIAAVGVYAVGDLLSGLLYEGYSFKDQVISELTALGSPVRPWMLAAMTAHGLLVAAFGVGIWRSAGRSRNLRWVGPLLIASSIVGFFTQVVFPMSSRWMEPSFTDTMHIIGTGVWSLFVLVAMVLSAVAYRGRFRLYSIVTLLVLVGFGTASSIAMGGVEENLTPWAGGFERINAYAFFAWLIVLAVTVMRRSLGQVTHEKGVTEVAQTRAPSLVASG
jgi:Protein of unknown function (DUF998)